MMVSMNVPVIETRPCSTGSSVFAAAAAIGAEPSPDSFEKIPRATPAWIAVITVAPAIFMTAVTFSYIMQADEGFKLPGTVGNIIGVVAAVLFAVAFFIKANKVKKAGHNKVA